MEVTFEQASIKVTHDEVWDIMFCIINDLLHTVETHWVNRADEDMTQQKFVDMVLENESKNMKMIKTFSNVLDRPDIAEGVPYRIVDVFEKSKSKPTQ